MKTKEELEIIKTEFLSLNKKLRELSEDELKEVVGGVETQQDPTMEPQFSFGIWFDGCYAPITDNK